MLPIAFAARARTDASASLRVGAIYGTPTPDPKGRLVYQGTPQNQSQALIELNQKTQTEKSATSAGAIDSAPIVRADFDTRKVDTIATMKIVQQYSSVVVTRDDRGNLTQKLTVIPTQTADECACCRTAQSPFSVRIATTWSG